MDTTSVTKKIKKRRFIQTIHYISWIVTLFFLAALIWAIYQAVVNGNPLPTWTWSGVLLVLAVVTGLVVMVVVYQGVSKQAGPFDYRKSNRVAGEIINETKHVQAGGASSLRAEIHMMQGVLQLSGGASHALEAAFTYDDADWKPPVVDYAVDAAGKGNLVVNQSATGRPAMRQGRCEWVIRLNQALPIELNVKFGAGEADLRLGGIALDRLRVESGVGRLVLDLSGDWKRNLTAFIKTGIGDTTVRLPQDVGVRIISTIGFGSFQPHGMTWDGEAYTNALYGTVAVNLEISIEVGMGKVVFS